MVFNFMYISGHPVGVVSANMAKYFPFQNSLGSFHDDTFPHNLPRNPLVWTCDDVKWWLQWTIVEFSLDVFDVEKINFDGRQLASMDQLSFCAIFPEYVGDVLWQHLASLIRSVEYTPSSSCNIPAKYKGRGDNKGDSWEFPCFDISGVQSRYDFLEGSLSPWTFYSHDHPRTSYQRQNFSEICSAFNLEPTAQEYHQNFSRLPSCMYESSSENLPVIHASFRQLPVQGFNHMASTKDSKTIVSRSIGQGPIQLWEFLLELLLDPRLSDVIAWTGDGWEFKLINPEAVAELWGRKKCKPRMNYEKLSRGLRYYYDKKIIIKTAGKRYVYRFVCDMRQLVHCDSPQELYSRCKTNYKNSFYNFYSC